MERGAGRGGLVSQIGALADLHSWEGMSFVRTHVFRIAVAMGCLTTQAHAASQLMDYFDSFTVTNQNRGMS